MARSSEWGFMNDKELISKLESIALTVIYEAINELVPEDGNGDSLEKINVITGVLLFLQKIREQMESERESNGTVDN